jgi:hypothetical protein
MSSRVNARPTLGVFSPVKLFSAFINFIRLRISRGCPPEDCGGTWGYEELSKFFAIHPTKNMKAC